MISSFHRLREDEEGQTLVLAALFGLILALSVLSTVNLGRAVYDKMQLQTACDNGAYSQAAVEARVMNYTAYTNRAMVVHYASIMAMSAYLTWMHFNWAMIKGALALAKFIPPIAGIVQTIDQIASQVVRIFDAIVLFATPIIAAANLALYAFQEGAWWAVYLNRLSKIPPEAHSGDSTTHPYVPIWPVLVPLANATVFSQTRGHVLMFQNTLESASILINARSNVVQNARLQMLEIANSARQPWVAYGDRYQNPSLSPGARHWKWPLVFCNAQVGSTARTELGSYAPSGGISLVTKATGQVWSGERLQVDANCNFLGIFHIDNYIQLFGVVTLDDMFQTPSARVLDLNAQGIIGKLIGKLLGGTGAFQAMSNFARQTLPNPNSRRIFFISPYVFFHPNAHATPRGGLSGQLGNFAQPDVVFGLAKEGRDYNREVGAQEYYGKVFSFNGKAAGSGAVDFNYGNQDWPRVGGLPLLHKGFNTFCAAQAYYHRPGDWREMPNFFNPLWGARLMPVMESNAAAALGITAVPQLQTFLTH